VSRIKRLIRNTRFFVAFIAMASTVLGQPISPSAQQQINDILAIKASMNPAQQKISSDLVFAGMVARNSSIGSVSSSVVSTGIADAQGNVTVDVQGVVSQTLLGRIAALGGTLVNSFADLASVRASLPLSAVEALAASGDVTSIRTADRALANVGSVTSQGYVAHAANKVAGLGVTGSGVRVGILSTSATTARVAALIASGDLPADTVVVPGQDGFTTFGANDDEGTAMMEIVHDLAPGAKLFFATGEGGQANFANNIKTLRNTYNCDIIADDLTYLAEGAFQDGTVAAAVNAVTSAGALYFSSAANSGNLTLGTSGTWEGDFVNGGPVGGPIAAAGETGFVHSFGATPYDVLTVTSGAISLKWSDPLGASTNDYDLFILDSTGTTVKGFSASAQTGTQDPFEFIGQGTGCGTASASGYCPAAGDRIVVVLLSGTTRALRIDTNRGRLSIATTGSTYGHNAGLNTVSTAATAWNSAHAGTKAFSGFANPIETFSSDGPRKIFYNPDGTAITPGNVLFGTNGGTTLLKPDITAADGTFAATPGFLPFFGTSAAAPHAAAIAALVKSALPGLTGPQILSIMKSTALDTMAVGVDRDSGSGIVMALPAVQKAMAP
jgi:hypothetical protein